MKILLAIAHYFRGEKDSIHASTGEAGREQRAAVVRSVIESWRGHLGPSSILSVRHRRYEPIEAAHQLDIAVLRRGADHLFDDASCRQLSVRPIEVRTEDPRLIPFAAHKLFADSSNSYDMFVYSEDDIRTSDAWLLTKIAGFVEEFGAKRIVMPNRYEWNPLGPTRKSYIDGDLRPSVLEQYFEAIPDEMTLLQKAPGRVVSYSRALNPHSGFFAITSEQLKYWMRQPHFLDNDCSFIRPLESAATLGMLKTFSIYKSAGLDMGWIEMEHLDNRYSGLDLPRLKAIQPAGG
jgi:hypothetical protein